MLRAEDLQILINKTVAAIPFKQDPAELYEPIVYILEGEGKRLRPLMALMACNLFSDSVEKAILPAVGIEVFHNFTLLHDDIMDKADIRRHRPTVHKKWNENVAILSGDAMMIKAYEFFFGLEPELLIKILPVFNYTALQVCEGQQLDMNFESRMDVASSEYIQMITLKTAVLIACSLKVGALIGGASGEEADLLYQYGLNLGIIFQLQDDYLDVYGDEKVFGKQIGGDIVCNKKTFLLITALEHAKGEIRNKLLYLLHVEPDINEKILGVSEIYNELKIPAIVNNRIKNYYTEGIAYLNRLNVPDFRKRNLSELSDSLINRKK